MQQDQNHSNNNNNNNSSHNLKNLGCDMETLKKLQKGWHNKKIKEAEVNFWFQEAQIEGQIPVDLRGTFIRNGPGLNEIYGKKLKHPIDGDGFICAITFEGGKAHFKSKFAESFSHREEKKTGKVQYDGQMGLRKNTQTIQVLSGFKDMILMKKPQFIFRNPSNTNAYYWGGKIISCYETQLPVSFDPYTLKSNEEDNLGGLLTQRTYGAHFRYDSHKNLLIGFSLRVSLEKSPSISFYEFDPQWKCMHQKDIPIKGLTYCHDFIATENYYVIHMTPFVKVTKEIALKIYLGKASFGDLMGYYPDLPSQFIIIPRYTNQEPIFIPIEPCHIFHYGIAKENKQENQIQLSAVALPKEFNMEFKHKLWLSNSDVAPGNYINYNLDLNQKTCKREVLSTHSCEFPTVHPYKHVLKQDESCKYSYLMSNARGFNLPYQDIIKHDIESGETDIWNSEGGIGEPIFAPKVGSQSEDDGYVLVQLFNIEIMKTQFIILDAKNLKQGPVARLTCNNPVPFGFHGTFTENVFLHNKQYIEQKIQPKL